MCVVDRARPLWRAPSFWCVIEGQSFAKASGGASMTGDFMFKFVWVSMAAMLLGGSCVPTDITGCPLEPADALGQYCPENGHQCGEFSLCDPCTSDLSDCEMIECRENAWVEVEVLDVCPADAGG
jgi:hypothetical protein